MAVIKTAGWSAAIPGTGKKDRFSLVVFFHQRLRPRKGITSKSRVANFWNGKLLDQSTELL